MRRDGWHTSSRTAEGDRVGKEHGQTTAEYAVIVGFFAILVIAGVILLRGGLANVFERGGNDVATFRPPVACDASYAGGCVPPHPPDVDCADLAALGIGKVTLTGSDDPHGLDPDGDGIGCN